MSQCCVTGPLFHQCFLFVSQLPHLIMPIYHRCQECTPSWRVCIQERVLHPSRVTPPQATAAYQTAKHTPAHPSPQVLWTHFLFVKTIVFCLVGGWVLNKCIVKLLISNACHITFMVKTCKLFPKPIVR